MKTKNNIMNYILTIIGILTLCFVSVICILNKNAKGIVFASEDEAVSMTEEVADTTVKGNIIWTDDQGNLF